MGRQAALKRSQEMECSICMERVLDKGPLSQRKFGLLDCDHPFCLACLRSWRAQTDSGADLDSVACQLHSCLASYRLARVYYFTIEQLVILLMVFRMLTCKLGVVHAISTLENILYP